MVCRTIIKRRKVPSGINPNFWKLANSVTAISIFKLGQ